ncbi:MAG TPA: SRPBCC family protein [Chloroflexia bacterium]|nr:SRPBCC family protein [Chloroflexia bacterium]
MIEHSVDITINRPVAEVFSWLTNEKNHPRWDSGSVEMKSVTQGPWHAGMTFHEIRKVGGRNTSVRSRIAALEPNHRFEIESLTGPEWHGIWLFSPANSGSGTRLQFRGQLGFKGLMKVMEPLIGGSFKKQVDTNFAKLKGILESEP